MNKAITTIAALAMGATPVATTAAADTAGKTVVLVHGAFVDGSGWAGVYRILREKGYRVVIVQNPTITLADDVAATRRAIADAAGDVVLVGHSYGGVVITEAGVDPKVSALVYVAAFAPDAGESVASILAAAPPGAPSPPILPPADGFLSIDKAKFHAAFAADVAAETARFMADSQQPWGVQALQGAITRPAWRTKPSWYLVAQDDQMIPPEAQRAMAGRAAATMRAIPGSHAVYVSNPKAVVGIIEDAAAARVVAAAK
jgi:pimeloyl-ACP methyl ester carboxylesterase